MACGTHFYSVFAIYNASVQRGGGVLQGRIICVSLGFTIALTSYHLVSLGACICAGIQLGMVLVHRRIRNRSHFFPFGCQQFF